MKKSKINDFIRKLSQETLDDKIQWNYLTNLQNVSERSNPAIFFLLFEGEWRHINHNDSYYAIINIGEVYILNENTESGRDGTSVSGYNLYVHRECSENVFNLPCTQSDIYRLLNSINSSLSKKEADIESFIDEYLSDGN